VRPSARTLTSATRSFAADSAWTQDIAASPAFIHDGSKCPEDGVEAVQLDSFMHVNSFTADPAGGFTEHFHCRAGACWRRTSLLKAAAEAAGVSDAPSASAWVRITQRTMPAR
jgi:hypothetical protein